MVTADLPVYHCPHTVETIVIDGRLDEPVWRDAPTARLVPASGARGRTPRTTVRACWSDTHLYLAFECEDTDIWGSLRNRDDPLYDEEVVEAFLCPSGDTRRYYEIEVSPHNVVFDAALFNPDADRSTMVTDAAWTCEGMETAVASSAQIHSLPTEQRSVRGPAGRWTVEVSIPLSSVAQQAPRIGDQWRANFFRIERNTKTQLLAWSPTLQTPVDFHTPQRFGHLRFVLGKTDSRTSGVWSKSRARDWYRRQPWLVGCNYIPSTASNQLEMWQAQTFDPNTIDRELGWAARLGMNIVRVYLHDLAWQSDRDGLHTRMRQFLKIASAHRVRTVFVLFDDCWNDNPRPGPQPAPTPGVHNSRWLQSPGRRIVNDPTAWDRLERYVADVVGSFGRDRRVVMWDLYNEPGNSDQGTRSLPLLRKVFDWARAARPAQPLTVGVWHDNAELNGFQIQASDVITFHNYSDAHDLRKQIADLRQHGRPLICTEWMARPTSVISTHLPVFKEQRVGCLNWGLVSGKTQTIYPWRSEPGGPEPLTWFHDLLRPDGSPYDPQEGLTLKRLTGVRP